MGQRAGTLTVSLPTLLFGLVIMTTLPVRSGRLSSFHLGLLSFPDPPRRRSAGSWAEEDSGAEDDMEKEREKPGKDGRSLAWSVKSVSIYTRLRSWLRAAVLRHAS